MRTMNVQQDMARALLQQERAQDPYEEACIDCGALVGEFHLPDCAVLVGA